MNAPFTTHTGIAAPMRLPNIDTDQIIPSREMKTVLLGGANFGCGSSREHAVWALKEYGIRAVIAPSFGEIFHGNMIGNGLLPIQLPDAVIDTLPHEVEIDLPAQTVNGHRFEIGAGAKRRLVEGLDAIAETLQEDAAIRAWLAKDEEARPWVY